MCWTDRQTDGQTDRTDCLYLLCASACGVKQYEVLCANEGNSVRHTHPLHQRWTWPSCGRASAGRNPWRQSWQPPTVGPWQPPEAGKGGQSQPAEPSPGPCPYPPSCRNTIKKVMKAPTGTSTQAYTYTKQDKNKKNTEAYWEGDLTYVNQRWWVTELKAWEKGITYGLTACGAIPRYFIYIPDQPPQVPTGFSSMQSMPRPTYGLLRMTNNLVVPYNMEGIDRSATKQWVHSQSVFQQLHVPQCLSNHVQGPTEVGLHCCQKVREERLVSWDQSLTTAAAHWSL